MRRLLGKLFQFRLPPDQREAQLRRMLFVETNIMLAIKVVAMIGAVYLYQLVLVGSPDFVAKNEGPQAYFTQLKFYAAGNLLFWVLLLAAHFGELWPGVLSFSAFCLTTIDGLFLSALIYFTGGQESPLYWLYIGLLIRNAINYPLFWRQLMMTLAMCGFYTLALGIDAENYDFLTNQLYWLRVAVLMLVGACCWGTYALMVRERRRAEAHQEFQFRAGKMAATGRLAAEIAHQLKNPLGIINNAAFSIQRAIEKERPPSLETVALIRSEVSRSDQILTELMNYAQLSEGRIEQVNLNDVLEHALAQVLPAELPTGIKVLRALEPLLPAVAVQRSQLEEAFVNIIKNACEAMHGEGTLSISTRYAGAGVIEIEITDSGEGMTEEVVERIFEPFFTNKEGGTGLGLAIAKNVIDTYDGRVSVQSTPGKGTRFMITLPTRTISTV
jgi:signal transduction histidine kinase